MQTKPTTLPSRVDSSMLAKYLQAGEPVIVAKLVGVGNTAAYDFRDRASRVYVFRWESQQGGHILRVPLSLWNADKGRIAHDIMDQRGMLRPIVVTVEMPNVQELLAKLPEAASTGPSLEDSLEGIISAMVNDPDYAWSWHCNIVMAAHDSGAGPHDACNRGAALFLKLLSDGRVDTTTHPAYAQTQTPLPLTGAETSSQGELDSSEAHNLAPAGSIPAPDTTSKPEMDATAADSAPNVVGQGEEAPVASASAPSAPDAPLVASGQIMHQDKPMFSAAWDKLESPMRIKALAALLDTDEETLKTAIQDPLSTVELGHAGWVKRREPQA